MKLSCTLASILPLTAGLTSVAFAQTPTPDAPPAAAEPSSTAASEGSAAPAAAPPTEVTPAPVPTTPEPAVTEALAAEQPLPLPVPPPPDAAAAEEAEAAPSGPSIDLALFADTYVSYNSAKYGTPVPYHRAYDNNAPYDAVSGFPTNEAGEPAALVNRNGFGLSFVGLDATFKAGIVGATALLRFGPSVPIYYGTDTSAAGINSFLGGYVTITPTESLALDAGYFGTIYGVELAESWRNLNYSRGGLYYAMQPFYHFGVKGKYTFNEHFNVTAMVVNGANNVSDENNSPAFGLQLGLTQLGDVFNLSVGGFYETGDDSAWGIESFLDVVASLTLDDLTVLANFDYNVNRGADGAEDTSYYGIMGAASYAITPQVGVAARGEYLMDIDSDIWTSGLEDVSVTTLTGTLDLKLVDHLYVRPEVRYEMSSEDIYFNRSGSPTDGWWTGMIGLVASSAK